MKKAIIILSAAMLLTAACPVLPETLTVTAAEEEYTEQKDHDFSYRIYKDHVTVMGVETSGGDLVIPAEVDGIPVTDWDPDAKIPGFYAFHLTVDENNPYFEIVNDALICKTSKVMILYVGNSRNPENPDEFLADYQIPDGVKIVGKQAFRNARFTHTVLIPDSVTALKLGSLQKTGITEVTIPASVTEIGEAALNSHSMKKIMLSEGNTAFKLMDGVLFSADGGTLVCYPQEDERTAYALPEGVTTFYDDAFFGCSFIKELTVPASFTGSLRPAESLYSLEKFIIAAENPAYSAIGSVVFDKAGTTLVKFPVGLCEEQIYYVPQGTKTVADYAFYDAKFSGVVFPESVESLGKNCMWGTKYRSLKCFKVLNPACEIPRMSLEFGVGINPSGTADVPIGTVFGYEKSTAEKFAQQRGYDFTPLKSEPGDINLDGIYNIADAVVMQKYLTGERSGSTVSGKTADMNGDGAVNAVDLTLLLRKLIEIPRCTLTVTTDADTEPQTYTVAEGDILYELVGKKIGFETGEKYSTIGKALVIQKIDESGVTYAVVSRDYSQKSGTAKFGAGFAVNPLLKGREGNEHTYTLTFSDYRFGKPAADNPS